jgi:4-carboxymuconolactone decarboxylase
MMARKAGLAGAVIDDLRVGRRPSALDADERVIYEYADALNRTKHVPEAIYRGALDRWDVVGVVELTALIGYYTMVAMTLNAHEIPLPDGAVPPLEPVAA